MFRKVKKNAGGEIVLKSADPHGMRICGEVNPAKDSAEYVGRFDITGHPIKCLKDYTVDTVQFPGFVNIKRGNKGEVMQYDHGYQPEWVGVIFKLDDGTMMHGWVPIGCLAISTTDLLADWLSYCKQDAATTDPIGSDPTSFMRAPFDDEMDVYFSGLSTVTQIDTNNAVKNDGKEVESKRKLYYRKGSNGHSDDKHDLCLTTSADVGPAPGTQGHFLVEILRHGTSHPYRYCTAGEYAMWSLESFAKTVAFAFLYETDGGWKKMYFRGQELELLDDDVPRSLSYIFIACSFALSLSQISIPNHWLTPWMPDFGIATVWNLSFKQKSDKQEHTAVRETRTVNPATIGPLRYKSPADFRVYLNSLGCQTIMDAQVTAGMKGLGGWRSRNSCNLTQIKSMLAILAAEDEAHLDDDAKTTVVKPGNPEDGPCELCMSMGFVCAFERDIRLFSKNKPTDEQTLAVILMRDMAPLHWYPSFDPNPIVDATFLGLATGYWKDSIFK